ncbi:hypothetical protein HZB89_01850 [archaeon]|nr:hypothetical protein [archaeon]
MKGLAGILLSAIIVFAVSYAFIGMLPMLDLMVVFLFGLSAAIIAFTFFEALTGRHKGVQLMPLLIGVLPFAFALGELSEFIEHWTGIEFFGTLEAALAIIGIAALIYVLSFNLKNIFSEGGICK